ncbi:MAG: mechanosensitive ion channel domain-containing protein [Planctomycetota bacterium]
MNEFLGQELTNFWPAVGLAIGFPAVLLLLNEAISFCERRELAVGRTLRTVRNLVIPCLAALVFCRYVLGLAEENTLVRVVQTIFLVFLLYALLGVVNDLVFGTRDSASWRARVPKLFRDLSRALLVAIGAMFIYSKVWGYELTNALTALGVGSVVIGLALQEPLGNIVSGLMLLFERPLNVGDYVVADGTTGKVIEINWRSVHIETPTRELRIVPNVSLYKDAFSNLSRPTTVRTEVLEMGFSYDDPPNRVKEVMGELLRTTPGVLAEPAPVVRTASYADFSVIYKLVFSVARQEELAATRDEILSRLWYVARREGLTIPFPTAFEYGPGESASPPPTTPAELLREHVRFQAAVKDEVEHAPGVVEYAAGETIQAIGRRFEGFALIVKGKAELTTRDSAGKVIEIGEIGPGECFGNQVAIGGATDEIGIRAVNDLKVLVFDSESIDDLLKRSPSLAAEIGDAIESRRQAAQAARVRR